jgi:hypothetical protein
MRLGPRLLAGCAFTAAVLLAGTASANAVGASPRKGRPELVQSGHVPLGNCPADDIVMRVSIARSTYGPSQPVKITAVVRNRGTHTCTYDGSLGSAQEIGPCGAFSLQVFTHGGEDAWPGSGTFACPAIGAASLAPNAEVGAVGTWPKLLVTGTGVRATSRAAPAGSYRLEVDRRFSFAIRLR